MKKVGFVGLVGSPNAGKSSILNAIFQEKIAIVSDKVQTTRDAIKGIYNDQEAQIVFIDTPGFHKPQNQLQVYMNKQIENTLLDLDLLIYVLDAKYELGKKEQRILKRIRELKDIKKIAVINKIDLIDENKLNRIFDNLEKEELFDAILPISVLKFFDVKQFINLIKKELPTGYQFYEDDALVDYTHEFYIEEIVREKLFLNTHQEVPHSVAINIYDIEKEKNKWFIMIDIIVERDSQKGIIIGKNGSNIKKIGTLARKELEKKLNLKIYLDIKVKVVKKWNQEERELNKLGYELN